MATVENRIASSTVFTVLIAVTACHLINDTLQALLLAMYPMLRDSYALTFGQIGMITLVFQGTASILQPLIGHYTDRRPLPYSLPIAPAFTLLGLVLLGMATSYPLILVAAGAIGIGSAIFHPEASRVARIASGGRYGMAQSLFQVGGNIGSSIGPLLAAWIILPHGQASVLWFGAIALAAIGILSNVGRWYSHHLRPKNTARPAPLVHHNLSSRIVSLSLLILLALMFSKFVYTSAFSSFIPLFVHIF